MDTYTLLRSFADSWWLLGMVGFFIGVSAYALRPGSRDIHAAIARIPLGDDAEPAPPPRPMPVLQAEEPSLPIGCRACPRRLAGKCTHER
ncbi:MAG: cbb3-type cytochrome c oxidase subunit 3 [Pseudomonadota bacterium]